MAKAPKPANAPKPRKRKSKAGPPRWHALSTALEIFASGRFTVQSQNHIRPLHYYSACRLVIEGGFLPQHITPTPPLRVESADGEHVLHYDESAAEPGEHTIFGGLKTKDVDVVVSLPRVGPVVAISMKGTLTAFRNLTNRMEEAAGDCTNIHMAYPGLVYAFWHVFRGNVEGVPPAGTPKSFKLIDGEYDPADVALHSDKRLTSFLARYFFAMERLSGRSDLRDDPSSYEGVGMTLVDVSDVCSGGVVQDHPSLESPLRHARMFEAIYRQYDLRYVYQSPALRKITERRSWSADSPAFAAILGMDFEPRVGVLELGDVDEETSEADAAEADEMEQATEEESP